MIKGMDLFNKINKRDSETKYESRYYTVQNNKYFNHRGMLDRTTKIPKLQVCEGKNIFI